LVLPALASAHIERASYWPDPKPDCSIHPCAGGEVPTARPLSSAASTVRGGLTCTTSRSVVVKLKGPKGQRLRSARIYVNGRRVRTLSARTRLPTRVTLNGVPTGFVTVAMSGTTTGGKRVSSRRVVHICVGSAAKRTAARAVSGTGVTRVVCLADSLARTQQSIVNAESDGYVLRPSQPRVKISAAQGSTLLDINRQLLDRCGYHSIQDAVTASGNNDRVVVMPGIYTEPKSRSAPTHDPKCAQYTITNDHNTPGAVSYAYQVHCPNDANLIAVLGRVPGTKASPQPPSEDRHGIPDLGPCVRCNLQLEGSGASPDDVVIDGGTVAAGDKASKENVKDVGIHVDRADGFVLRNVKIRHVNEHGIYVLESDGVLLDRFKAVYANDYGVLTFVEDHFLMQNCEATGSGDSGLYPGASADTGNQRDPSIYPTFRYSSEIANCDSHHNSSGYSGTDGNAVHLHNNDFYDNALGFTTDVFTAPGHPGYPQDSDLIENNNFYSNNFNPYIAGSDVRPTVPVPVGTGLWIAGGNDNIVRNNHFWNNWRRGIMLFAVPDQVVCGPAGVDPTLLAGCNPTAFPPSTSYRNQFYGNVMGKSPSGEVLPNGTGDVTTGRTDFWWDQYLGNTGNCWHDNTGKDGTQGGVTSTPPAPFLPSACSSSSMGTIGPQQEPELINCLADFTFNPDHAPPSTCPWFTTPSKP
jgi:hypothetical protein